MPAISPFWLKKIAYTSFFTVVVVSAFAAPASRTTMLGPTPSSKPPLLTRY
jgi:hypothetical protein